MPLRAIEVEGYRGVARGRLTFNDTTVLFGENDSGRTGMIEALVLALGGSGQAFEDHVEPVHFRRTETGRTRPLRVRLELDEGAPGAWAPPTAIATAFPTGDRPRRLTVSFEATLDPAANSVTTAHQFTSPDRPAAAVPGDAETLAWLRGAHTLLWLEPGRLTGLIEEDTGADDELGRDPAVRDLQRHHRHILAGDVDDMTAELEAGARAAQAVLDRYRNVFAGSGPVLGAIAAEILAGERPAARGPNRPAATPAQKLAVLLLLGALAQLARRALRDGPQPADARPILLVENPEANLHPTTLASLWRVLEGMAWQKIVTTHSDTILASAPLTSLRRLTRTDGQVREWSVAPGALAHDALRKIDYHLRSRRSAAMFARFWILVEGETEYWVMPELAHILGYDLEQEGVACVEFAQCGIGPLVVLADQLGIEGHVLVDGDEGGSRHAGAARAVAGSRDGRSLPLTMLREVDIEHCFWRHGFDDVIRGVANLTHPAGSHYTIRRAIEKTSKPYLALSLIDAAARRGPESIPAVLARLIESAVHTARA